MRFRQSLLTRLRQLQRSSGWPSGDAIEVELLAAGLVLAERDSLGRESLRLTEEGLAVLAASLQANRARRDAHESLVEQVAQWMHREGRLVWRAPALRASVVQEEGASAWALGLPDVFSIRPSSREDALEPVVHEVKVSRADLLGELRRPDKRAAYLAVCQQMYYVLGQDAHGRPIATADEIPPECGVVQAAAGGLEMLRVAPRRPLLRLGFEVWLALAKADRFRSDEEPPQLSL